MESNAFKNGKFDILTDSRLGYQAFELTFPVAKGIEPIGLIRLLIASASAPWEGTI